MADTLISVDLNESPLTNENIHNRWHPDIPINVWVEPGDEFKIETYDWTGGQIANNDDAADVRDVELEQVHYLSGPIGVKGAEPGDLLVVDILDIGAKEEMLWGFNGFFSNFLGNFTCSFFEKRSSVGSFRHLFFSYINEILKLFQEFLRIISAPRGNCGEILYIVGICMLKMTTPGGWTVFEECSRWWILCDWIISEAS